MPRAHRLSSHQEQDTRAQVGRVVRYGPQQLREQHIVQRCFAARFIHLAQLVDYLMLGVGDFDGCHRAKQFTQQPGHFANRFLVCLAVLSNTGVRHVNDGQYEHQGQEDR